MKSNQFIIFAIVLLVFFTVDSTRVLAKDTTAKDGLVQAKQAAKKWQADAVLVNISTYTGNMDGTAGKWAYMFYSSKAKKGYDVMMGKGKIIELLEVRGHIKTPVGNKFIDSSQAMAEAKKNGLKVKGKPSMLLHIMGKAGKNSGVYWAVSGGFTPGEMRIVIDARTGKFFSRQEAN